MMRLLGDAADGIADSVLLRDLASFGFPLLFLLDLLQRESPEGCVGGLDQDGDEEDEEKH